MAALVEGRTEPATMAELAKGSLHSKIPVLEQALTGLVRDQHRVRAARKRTRKGNHALPTCLTQLAQASARTKGTYLSALYQRLAARRERKRAIRRRRPYDSRQCL